MWLIATWGASCRHDSASPKTGAWPSLIMSIISWGHESYCPYTLQWAAHQLPSQQLQASRRDDELVGYCRRVCVQPSDMGGRVPWGVAGVFFTKLHFLDFLSFFADDSKKRLRRLSWGRTRIFLVGFFPFARRLIFTFNVFSQLHSLNQAQKSSSHYSSQRSLTLTSTHICWSETMVLEL